MSLNKDQISLACRPRKENDLSQPFPEPAKYAEDEEVIDLICDSNYHDENNQSQRAQYGSQRVGQNSLLEAFKFFYEILAEVGGPPVAMLLAYGLVISQISTALLPISLVATVTASAYLTASGFYFFVKAR